MEPFRRIAGTSAPMPIDNVDTDAIIPSKETQSTARTGYGEKLFANWRYLPGTRAPNPDFVLNNPRYAGAQLLVAGRNFGCGSSREAAVWALSQFGVRAVIAESYGAIFRNNCIRNGVLPAVLPIAAVEQVLAELADGAIAPQMAVDLETCTIVSPSGAVFGFQIGSLEREMLMQGADEIELTLMKRPLIEAFRARDQALRPWVYASQEATHAQDH